MTVKIDIDKYTTNSPLISKMLHMADQGKFGEGENGNGMLDTQKEVNRFMKLAEKNKDLLAKNGYKIEGNDGIFTIIRTNSEYDSKKYNSVLTYDRKHDFIEEKTNAMGLTAKTVFNNNNDIKTTLVDSETDELYANVNNKGDISSTSFTLPLLNIFTFGGINRRLNTMNLLSNIWGKK